MCIWIHRSLIQSKEGYIQLQSAPQRKTGHGQARKKGLYTNYVTNGFITEEALDIIGPYLDVYRVDIKGFSADTCQKIAHTPDFELILKGAEKAKRCGMHVEVVTNVIPGFNDDEAGLKGIG